MTVSIKYPNNIDLKIKCNSDILTASESVLTDNCFHNKYVLEDCNSFEIIINSDVRPFNTRLFGRNWINGIKWSFISADWQPECQSWKISFNDLGRVRKRHIDFNIEAAYTDNYYNGYVKKYELSVENQRNAKINIDCTTHVKPFDILRMYSLIFLNQIPLILLIALFLYSDIAHPEWFKSGAFFIFLFDIPLLILLIINISIAVYQTKRIIKWIK